MLVFISQFIKQHLFLVAEAAASHRRAAADAGGGALEGAGAGVVVAGFGGGAGHVVVAERLLSDAAVGAARVAHVSRVVGQVRKLLLLLLLLLLFDALLVACRVEVVDELHLLLHGG